MVMFYRSKYSPDFPADPTGRDAPFRIGDRAVCKNMRNPADNGTVVVIKSEIMVHDEAAKEAKSNPLIQDDKVYEVKFPDGGVSAVSIDRLHHIDFFKEKPSDVG